MWTLNKEKETDNKPAVAIELPDGKIVTGRTTDLLGASAAALLNALKALGNIDDEVELIEKEAIEASNGKITVEKSEEGIYFKEDNRLYKIL